MRKPDWSFQPTFIAQVLDSFKKGIKKILLNLVCGAGKTKIGLSVGQQTPGRILILSYIQEDLREHWGKQAQEYGISNDDFQVVVSDLSFYKGKGLPVVTVDNIDPTKKFTIVIPQTLRNFDLKKLGIFSLIIIDEAHVYLETDTEMGLMKKIMAQVSDKDTKYLGLTATGFNVMLKDKFFDIPEEDILILDVPDGVFRGIVTGLKINVIQFDFNLKDSFFNKKGQLTKHGCKVVKHKICVSEKVKEILKPEPVGKAIVIAPPLCDIAVTNMIRQQHSNKEVVVNNTMNTSAKSASEAERRFRTEKDIKYMVVKNRCCVGWDFHELETVIDLTFSRSPSLVIQRMLRCIRFSNKMEKQTGHYIYCCDRSRTEAQIIGLFDTVMYLCKKEGILAYKRGNGSTWIPDPGVFKFKFNRKFVHGMRTVASVNVDEWFKQFKIRAKKKTLIYRDVRSEFCELARQALMVSIMSWLSVTKENLDNKKAVALYKAFREQVNKPDTYAKACAFHKKYAPKAYQAWLAHRCQSHPSAFDMKHNIDFRKYR